MVIDKILLICVYWGFCKIIVKMLRMKMLIEKLINYILVNNFILLCSFFIGVRIIFSLIWKDSIYLLSRIFENLSCGLCFL